MTDDRYDRDVVAWSQQQAALLRRRPAGELVNDAELDWPNIAQVLWRVMAHRPSRITTNARSPTPLPPRDQPIPI